MLPFALPLFVQQQTSGPPPPPPPSFTAQPYDGHVQNGNPSSGSFGTLVTLSNGVGPYSYSWSLSGYGCSLSLSSSTSSAPTVFFSGLTHDGANFQLSVTVRDSAGNVASGTTTGALLM